MNVLSLFDGMSCGQIALKQLGIIPGKYYASEIDKHAIKQTQLNFPDTIQLGDVTQVDVSKLEPIDLLIGGSPCQSFSFAGKRVGMSTIDKEEIYTLDRYLELKEEGFQFEGESYLFWEYMRILTDIRQYNPNVLFLLENVEMGKKWERVLSGAIGVYGVHINSALVSAQNRKRIYWTNIRTKRDGLFDDLYSNIPQPADKGILLKDILEDEVDEKFYMSNKAISGIMNHKQRHMEKGSGFGAQFPTVKSNALLARCYKDGKENLICVAQPGRETYCLTSVQKDNLIMEDVRVKGFSYTDRGIRPHRGDYRKSGVSEYGTILYTDQKSDTHIASHVGMIVEEDSPLNKRQKANYKSADQKENSLLATSWKGSQSNGMTLTGIARIRRLTPTECARLQTIPSWYKWECSDTQQYRMLGNGWTIDVIAHILSYIKGKMNINVA
jgi:DNA (cytosine-5-)-methyltransferase